MLLQEDHFTPIFFWRGIEPNLRMRVIGTVERIGVHAINLKCFYQAYFQGVQQVPHSSRPKRHHTVNPH